MERLELIRSSTGNSVERLELVSLDWCLIFMKTRQCAKDCSHDLCHLGVLDSIDESILRLCCVILQLLGSVLFAKWCDLVEVHLQVMSHFFGKFIFGRASCKSKYGKERCYAHGHVCSDTRMDKTSLKLSVQWRLC